MFEFHGWIVLKSLSHAEFQKAKIDIEQFDKDTSKLQKRFLKQAEKLGVSEFVHAGNSLNTFISFSVQGLRNHCWTEVFELYVWVAKQGRGSYGLLHVLDGEGENYPDWHVWKLQDGQLTEHGDPYFSPWHPYKNFPERGKHRR